MKSVQDWLAIPEQKLGVELAKVLTPGPWKHDWQYGHAVGGVGGIATGASYCCEKCEFEATVDYAHPYSRQTRIKILKKIGEKKPCLVPDPIDINDWNVAMEWRDKAVKQNLEAWETALFDLCCAARDTYDSNERFLEGYAQPKHYLIAAACAAGRTEE